MTLHCLCLSYFEELRFSFVKVTQWNMIKYQRQVYSSVSNFTICDGCLSIIVAMNDSSAGFLDKRYC